MASAGVLDDGVTPFVHAIVVLDNAGARVTADYYSKDFPTLEKQKEFELALHGKIKRRAARVNAEILIYERHIILYKAAGDVVFLLVAGRTCNELLMLEVLTCLEHSLDTLLRQQVDHRTIIENLDMLLLAVDEIIDRGLILETSSDRVVERIMMKGATDGAAGNPALADLTVEEALIEVVQEVRKNWW